MGGRLALAGYKKPQVLGKYCHLTGSAPYQTKHWEPTATYIPWKTRALIASPQISHISAPGTNGSIQGLYKANIMTIKRRGISIQLFRRVE